MVGGLEDALHEHRAALRGVDFSGNRLALGRKHVGNDDRRALLREQADLRLSHTMRATADDGDLVLQAHFVSFYCLALLRYGRRSDS